MTRSQLAIGLAHMADSDQPALGNKALTGLRRTQHRDQRQGLSPNGPTQADLRIQPRQRSDGIASLHSCYTTRTPQLSRSLHQPMSRTMQKTPVRQAIRGFSVVGADGLEPPTSSVSGMIGGFRVSWWRLATLPISLVA